MATENHIAQGNNLQNRTAPAASIFKCRAPETGNIVLFKIYVGAPLSGGTAKFDLNINGVTVFTDQGNRLSIPDDFDNAIRIDTDMDITAVSKYDVITVDFDEFTGSETETGLIDVFIEFSET